MTRHLLPTPNHPALLPCFTRLIGPIIHYDLHMQHADLQRALRRQPDEVGRLLLCTECLSLVAAPQAGEAVCLTRLLQDLCCAYRRSRDAAHRRQQNGEEGIAAGRVLGKKTWYHETRLKHEPRSGGRDGRCSAAPVAAGLATVCCHHVQYTAGGSGKLSGGG